MRPTFKRIIYLSIFFILSMGSSCKKEQNCVNEDCALYHTGYVKFAPTSFGLYLVSVQDSTGNYIDSRYIDTETPSPWDSIYGLKTAVGCYTISVVAFQTSFTDPDSTYYFYNSCVAQCDTVKVNI